MFARIWNDFIAPMLGRPPRVQIAALCHRGRGAGLEVLLITSRTTRRWIIPKGWPVHGTDAAGTALHEAWEEAGVRHRGDTPPRIGRYRYDKILAGGLPVATDVDVYAIEVEALLDDFPEVRDRERRWMRPQEAARLVGEEQLRDMLLELPSLLGQVSQG